ncbi:MAG TPA: hypothetical protein VII22_25865 [Streptosporangiaceae bacterium]
MLRRSLLAVAMVLGSAGLAAAPAGIAAASVPAASVPASQPAPRCSGVIQITHLAFTPPAVTPGQIATANAVARNCTGTSQQASVFWLERFIGPGSGIPPGCPAIDPLPPRPVTFAPHGQVQSASGTLVPPGCTATQLQATVEFLQGATVLAQRTAYLTIIQPAG